MKMTRTVNLPQYGMEIVGLMACKVCSTSRVKAVWWVTMPNGITNKKTYV